MILGSLLSLFFQKRQDKGNSRPFERIAIVVTRLREVKVRGRTKEYRIVHRLVESYRNSESKVCQRVIMNLGIIDIPKSRWKELAFLLEQRYKGQEVFASQVS